MSIVAIRHRQFLTAVFDDFRLGIEGIGICFSTANIRERYYVVHTEYDAERGEARHWIHREVRKEEADGCHDMLEDLKKFVGVDDKGVHVRDYLL